MKHFPILAALFLLVSAGLSEAIVARPAPDVRWINSSGKTESLAAFKGQPIVLIIAPSPESRAFRSQIRRLKGIYERMGAQKVVFVAAFTQSGGRVPSNIPFVLAADGPRVGYDYDAQERFAIALIGRDGNLDYFTNRVLPGQRIYDVITNSFVTQTMMRRP
jgi:hypothetical protein